MYSGAGGGGGARLRAPERDGILYGLVAHGADVLAEFAAQNLSGNFSQVTRVLLTRLDTTNAARASYVLDGYQFHYLVSNGLVYLCMADESFGQLIPFQFLDDIRSRFVATYGEANAKRAIAYAFNAEFQGVIERRMQFYNSPNKHSKVEAVQNEISQVKSVMVNNIDRVLERGERIELLVDKSDRLDSHALRFRKHATTLRRSMWCKNVKAIALIFFALLAIVYIILSIACGGPGLSQCIH